MAASPRILFYNWVPFDDDEKRGGGVSIYQRNLIEALVKAGWPVDFFSGGVVYDQVNTGPRFERSDNIFDPDCRSFRFVNSPLLSPGHAAFGQNGRLFAKDAAFEAFIAFQKQYGPYDIVHFNNIEGIPFSFLDLKAHFPQTLVVLSHHNYFAICPQVNLWHAETEACTDFENGHKCVDCLVWRTPRAEVLAAHQAATMMKRLDLTAQSPAFGWVFGAGDLLHLLQLQARRDQPAFLADDGVPETHQATTPAPLMPGAQIAPDSHGFAWRRQQALALIDRSVDVNLAVSARVADIITSYGIDPGRVHVSYIGTKHGELLAKARKRMTLARPGHLSMAYLGYMRADKGFQFLLQALEELPIAQARRLHLTLAARSTGDPAIAGRLSALAGRLGSYTHVDGYSHTDLPRILQNVDIGVVPVMWEDNLPQVALEIMSHGVPILTSDRGGAQELGANPDFVFPAGSVTAFAEALRRLQTGEVPLGAFWARAMALRSMPDHLAELLAHYRAGLARLKGGGAIQPEPGAGPDPFDLEASAASDLQPTLPSAALLNWILHDA